MQDRKYAVRRTTTTAQMVSTKGYAQQKQAPTSVYSSNMYANPTCQTDCCQERRQLGGGGGGGGGG